MEQKGILNRVREGYKSKKRELKNLQSERKKLNESNKNIKRKRHLKLENPGRNPEMKRTNKTHLTLTEEYQAQM